MMAEKVQWSDLPTELCPVIGKRLNSAIDILRFRSVCNSWRSAIPPANRISVPGLHRKLVTTPFGKRSLSQTTIFRVEFYDCTRTPIASSQGWLIEVEELESGRLRLLNPFTNSSQSYQISPKVLNLINFRIVELTKAYYIDYHQICKIVLFPNSADKNNKNSMLFAVYEEGKLGFSRIGDDKWTLLDDKNFHYDDIIVFKEQLYVVDKWGTISWIDSISLKLVQFSPPLYLYGFGKKKHLVESCGSLHVVDLHVDGEPNSDKEKFHGLLYMIVYKLDEEWGTWVVVKNLGKRLFVLGKYCHFSFSARDFYDCEENCIYFCYDNRACVFSLASSTFKYPKVFWPSPTLFHPKFSSDQEDNALLVSMDKGFIRSEVRMNHTETGFSGE